MAARQWTEAEVADAIRLRMVTWTFKLGVGLIVPEILIGADVLHGETTAVVMAGDTPADDLIGILRAVADSLEMKSKAPLN